MAASAISRQTALSTQKVFSYCYEARSVFLAAQKLGISPILGQIDPGPVEDLKVSGIVKRWPSYQTPFQPGSEEYYRSWRDECRLARHIVVNSEWSKDALIQAGIDGNKLVVCPLVFTPPAETHDWKKYYPRSFSAERPLRVLFLGQCILRKGIAETIEAAQRMSDRPVEFYLVGNTDIAGFDNHFGCARIRHFPRVARAECNEFYRQADVFLFPTHSDGFGLTQLEAHAWKLPIIASEFCGKVVEAGRTGWILPEVSSSSIIQTVEEILADPATLGRRSAAIEAWPFTTEELGRRLVLLDSRAPIPQ